MNTIYLTSLFSANYLISSYPIFDQSHFELLLLNYLSAAHFMINITLISLKLSYISLQLTQISSNAQTQHPYYDRL